MDDSAKDTVKKRPRLPPTLKDIAYIAIISEPASGRSSNFEVFAIAMSDYSIIKLKYSRKTRLNPGTVIDLRDFGEMGHYSIEDRIPFEALGKRETAAIGEALISAGEKHPIGLLKARTMAEESIQNLFHLLNIDNPKRLRVFFEELKHSSKEDKIEHKDIFASFIKAFSGAKKTPDIKQQEALISICGNSMPVIVEITGAYLDFTAK